MNKILETTKFVVDNSNHIKISADKLNDFCESFKPEHIKHWLNEAPFNLQKLKTKDRLHFLLLFNSISFSYWGDPKWKIKYHNQELDGSYAMIAAIGKAFEQNIPILTAKHLSSITNSDLNKILEGTVQIPLFEDRLNIIHEIGEILMKNFGGDFSNLINQATGNAVELLNLIIENFPSFKDESTYKGKQIYFYKRAQLLVADIYQSFNGQNYGDLTNIQDITACADYKLPFMLRRLNIFSYSNYLADKIDNQIQIDKDSEEEIEIRANTIWTVEKIKHRLKGKLPNINSLQVNDHLWLLSQRKITNDKPYHLTRTTCY